MAGEVGKNSRQHRGAIGQSHRDEQQTTCSFAQVGNARSHQTDDKQRNKHRQEVAEDAVEREEYTHEPTGEKERTKNAQSYSHQNLWQDSKFAEFELHNGEKEVLFFVVD